MSDNPPFQVGDIVCPNMNNDYSEDLLPKDKTYTVKDCFISKSDAPNFNGQWVVILEEYEGILGIYSNEWKADIFDNTFQRNLNEEFKDAMRSHERLLEL